MFVLVTEQGLPTLLQGERDERERRHGVRPPSAPQRVQTEASENREVLHIANRDSTAFARKARDPMRLAMPDFHTNRSDIRTALATTSTTPGTLWRGRGEYPSNVVAACPEI